MTEHLPGSGKGVLNCTFTTFPQVAPQADMLARGPASQNTRAMAQLGTKITGPVTRGNRLKDVLLAELGDAS
jgi:hypothetical protein